MMFPVTEHIAKSQRHSTFYLACGADDAPPIVFVHGWPELSLSWRHQLPCFASLGFRAIAPDMRGYGRSSLYQRHEDYALEHAVEDMVELLDALGRDRAIWVGHDWGSPVVWALASHHPERSIAVASLCVPYFAQGFAPESFLPLIDRAIYPEAEYPLGQWDYQEFYAENFERARGDFEANVRNTVKALFRAGNPAALRKPARTATIRRDQGWFGGAGKAPEVPLDPAVLTREDLDRYVAALERSGFFGPDSWYMNRRRNTDYALRREWRQIGAAGAVPARGLRHRLRDPDLAPGRADAPGLPRPDRNHRALRPLDGAGEARRRQRRNRALARDQVPGAVGAVTAPVCAAALCSVRHGRACPACPGRPRLFCPVRAPAVVPQPLTPARDRAQERDAFQCGGQVFFVIGSAAMRRAQAVSLGPSRSAGWAGLARARKRCTSAACG